MKTLEVLRSTDGGGKSIEKCQHKDPWDPRGGICT